MISLENLEVPAKVFETKIVSTQPTPAQYKCVDLTLLIEISDDTFKEEDLNLMFKPGQDPAPTPVPGVGVG